MVNLIYKPTGLWVVERKLMATIHYDSTSCVTVPLCALPLKMFVAPYFSICSLASLTLCGDRENIFGLPYCTAMLQETDIQSCHQPNVHPTPPFLTC